MQVWHRPQSGAWWNCFNPHPARRPDARPLKPGAGSPRLTVSILIQPEDRMQVLVVFDPRSDGLLVSILIQPEDRMQVLIGAVLGALVLRFQSSSSPKTGCKVRVMSRFLELGMFQSSSSPKTGCKASCDSRGKATGKFQSSSSPKTGCKTPRSSQTGVGIRDSFNPHPARRPDASSGLTL